MLYRAIIRVFTATCAITMIFVGALHLRPYEHPIGFELIMPEPGCQSHCFLGIEPDVTTANTAVALLEAHSAVEEVVFLGGGKEGFDILWQWKSDHMLIYPDDPFRGTRISGNSEGIVTRIEVLLPFVVYDYWMIYGYPDKIYAVPSGASNQPPIFADTILYFDRFTISYVYKCGSEPNREIAKLYIPTPPSQGLSLSTAFGTAPC